MDNQTRSNVADGRFLSSNESNPVIRYINAFLYSPWYMTLPVLLTLLANVFALELVTYPIMFAVIIYAILFCRDMLPVAPWFVFAYISPSVENNPGRNPDSIFYPANGGWIIIGLLTLMLISLIVRFSFDKSLRKKLFFTPRRLWLGFVLLGLSYLLSGLGSPNYENVFKRNLLFAMLQFLSVAGLYWFFSGSIYWEKAPHNYFAWIGMTAGVILLVEILNIYVSCDIITNGRINTLDIFTGWGINNNMGAVLAMMLPFPYYFATQSKKSAPFCHLFGLFIMVGIVLTNSRGSILTASMIYALCMIVAVSVGKYRLFNGILCLVTVAIVASIVIAFQDSLVRVFALLIQKGLNPSGRDIIYQDGIKLYLQNPIFGESFFSETLTASWSQVELFKTYFPPRWHNTVIQLGASCGTAGLVAYGIHRVQTLRLFFQKENRTPQKIFLGLSILALLGTSLVDCNLFNIGPALYYSMALAFAEHCPAQNQ